MNDIIHFKTAGNVFKACQDTDLEIWIEPDALRRQECVKVTWNSVDDPSVNRHGVFQSVQYMQSILFFKCNKHNVINFPVYYKSGG